VKVSEQSPAHDAKEPDQHPKPTLARAKRSRPSRWSRLQWDYKVLVVMVVALVILGLIAWYIQATTIIGTCQTCGPVSLSAPTKGGDASNYTATFSVLVGPRSGYGRLSDFKAMIMMDGERLSTVPQTLVLGDLMRFGLNVTLSFTDSEGTGQLTTGDLFLVFGMTGMHQWSFQLIYALDGSLLSVVDWVTP